MSKSSQFQFDASQSGSLSEACRFYPNKDYDDERVIALRVLIERIVKKSTLPFRQKMGLLMHAAGVVLQEEIENSTMPRDEAINLIDGFRTATSTTLTYGADIAFQTRDAGRERRRIPNRAPLDCSPGTASASSNTFEAEATTDRA